VEGDNGVASPWDRRSAVRIVEDRNQGSSVFPHPAESAQIRRMIKFVSIGCVVGLLAFWGCSTTPKRPTVEELFKKADVSGDGRVSRKEYEDFMIVDMFAIYDANGDGYVTEAEFVADGGTASMFRELNVSGTGKLTKDEAMKSAFIRNRVAAPFDEADVNHNGYVTWEEFQVALAKRRAYVR
jgi:Ca2+-binding EF-hand superfamily protein